MRMRQRQTLKKYSRIFLVSIEYNRGQSDEYKWKENEKFSQTRMLVGGWVEGVEGSKEKVKQNESKKNKENISE